MSEPWRYGNLQEHAVVFDKIEAWIFMTGKAYRGWHELADKAGLVEMDETAFKLKFPWLPKLPGKRYSK